MPLFLFPFFKQLQANASIFAGARYLPRCKAIFQIAKPLRRFRATSPSSRGGFWLGTLSRACAKTCRAISYQNGDKETET